MNESRNWVDCTIGEISKLSGGSAFKEKFQGHTSGEIPFIKVSDFNLSENQKYITRANNWVSSETLKEMGAKVFPPGSVVFPKVGAALLSNRRRILLRPTALDNNLMAAIPNGCCSEYLYHALCKVDFSRFVQEGAVPSINQEQVASVELSIPPLPEQKKIAEILSGIDTQRQALAKKAATASMLRNALGEKIFSSLDGERVALGELCNPKQWQTISANQLTTSGYPVYGANGKIGYFTEYNHKEPVLAVTCRGATCGNLTLIPAFSYVTGNSMCLDNPRKDTSPEYLFQFLAWRGLRDVVSGSAQPQITRSPLQAVEVVLPSKEKQDKIVSALQSVNNTEQLVNIALSRLDILKKAIAADLLSGRKRVSV